MSTTEHSRLNAQHVSLAYGEHLVAEDLSVEFPDGKITVIVGPNACGKSTALRAMARLLKPTRGSVFLDGKSISERPSKEVAQVLGLLPQSPIAPDSLTVRDLVGRGRHPHQSWWRQHGEGDADAIERALTATHMTALADRNVDELSGGQRQRAWIAMAVAQETDILLLDEPTTYLDIAHQLDVLELVADLNRTYGRTIVMVLHDLNLAIRYADHIIALRDGRKIVEGSPSQVVTPDFLREVFSVEGQVMTDPQTGAPIVLPYKTLPVR